jgi:hypothetical protein
MATYRILKEVQDETGAHFVPTGDTFTGTADETQAHVEMLQAEQGGSFAAEATGA